MSNSPLDNECSQEGDNLTLLKCVDITRDKMNGAKSLQRGQGLTSPNKN